ncbi:hypothetical protein CAJAP_09760 [Camponotus japonicus]
MVRTATFTQKSAQNETQDDKIYGGNVDDMELRSETGQVDLYNSEPKMQSVLLSAPMQLPPQSTPPPMVKSTPSPMLRSSPSPMLKSIPSPMQRSTPSSIQRSTPSPMQRSTPSPMQRFTPSPMQRSTPSPMQRFTPSPIRPSSAPLPRTPVSETGEPSTLARTLNTISSCFTGTNRLTKKPKVDSMETAFFQMNTTLGTMASRILQNRNDNDIRM